MSDLQQQAEVDAESLEDPHVQCPGPHEHNDDAHEAVEDQKGVGTFEQHNLSIIGRVAGERCQVGKAWRGGRDSG